MSKNSFTCLKIPSGSHFQCWTADEPLGLNISLGYDLSVCCVTSLLDNYQVTESSLTDLIGKITGLSFRLSSNREKDMSVEMIPTLFTTLLFNCCNVVTLIGLCHSKCCR